MVDDGAVGVDAARARTGVGAGLRHAGPVERAVRVRKTLGPTQWMFVAVWTHTRVADGDVPVGTALHVRAAR